MRNLPRRIGPVRVDHALLLLAGAVMSIGSLMSWIKGSTRLSGNIDWTGLDDTGEGLMLIAAALVLAALVRWRGMLEEIDPRFRFVPLGVAIACLLLVGLGLQKALYLSWFELDVGARPQPGLFLAGLGALIAIAGSVLAATDPDSVAAARAAAEREKRRSGAGGDGAASDRLRRGGGGRPPNPDEYSIVGRVARGGSVSARRGGEVDAEPDRGSSPPRSS